MQRGRAVYFTDVGLAAHLLDISSPSQVERDPLLGGLFENLVVIEALKARLQICLNRQYLHKSANMRLLFLHKIVKISLMFLHRHMGTDPRGRVYKIFSLWRANCQVAQSAA